MIIEQSIDRNIDQVLLERDKAERDAHVSSGKLTASGLGMPLQWQVLKALGIGVRVVDGYTLRKFARGKSVEEWITQFVPGIIVGQDPVSYRGVPGFVDLVVDTTDYDFNVGVMSLEIKSVTNAKFKRISTMGEADEGHRLQAGLYALAKGTTHYAVMYVASDDYRVLTFVYEVKDIKAQIDQIIDTFDAQMAKQEVPVFVPRYKWQADLTYCMYPEWMSLTEKEIELAINYHYPDVWDKRNN